MTTVEVTSQREHLLDKHLHPLPQIPPFVRVVCYLDLLYQVNERYLLLLL